MTTTKLINPEQTSKTGILSVRCFSLVAFFCLSLNLLQAQKVEEVFDYSFKPTKSAGRYYVITEQKENRWYREAYYLPEKTMAMKGWYKDKDCKIAEGEIAWYFANRFPKSKVNYLDGKKDGLSLTYHENGMIRDSANYTLGHRLGIGLGWDTDGYQVDSSNFDGVGNGVEVKWFSNGPVMSAGRMINDTTKINRWNYYHPNGQLNATEHYVSGNRINCSCYDASGKQLDSLICIKEEEAYFPQRENGWRTFLQKNLNPNVPVTNRAPEGSYMVIVQFIVDTDGSVKDIKPLTNFGFGMEAEVIRIMKKSPAWVPAMQFGRKVKAYRRQPVTFVVSRG